MISPYRDESCQSLCVFVRRFTISTETSMATLIAPPEWYWQMHAKHAKPLLL
jgi:hypothetical protein